MRIMEAIRRLADACVIECGPDAGVVEICFTPEVFGTIAKELKLHARDLGSLDVRDHRLKLLLNVPTGNIELTCGEGR